MTNLKKYIYKKVKTGARIFFYVKTVHKAVFYYFLTNIP